MHQFHKFISSWNSTCFGQFVCPSSGVYSMYTQQWYMSYRSVDSFRAGPGLVLVILYSWLVCGSICSCIPEIPNETLHVSDSSSVHHQSAIQNNKYQSWSCSKAAYKPVWHVSLLSVQWINSWWWTDELSETCRVSCQSKFARLMHLVGFIIKK
jgi:hypothetical protein